MTNNEIVQDWLRRMPDDASLQDIARELEFIAAVRQGLAELDNGDSVPIEEVENAHELSQSGRARGKIILRVYDKPNEGRNFD